MASERKYISTMSVSDSPDGEYSRNFIPNNVGEFNDELVSLGHSVADLLDTSGTGAKTEQLLANFVDCYFRALKAKNLSFSEVLRKNLEKTSSRFLLAKAMELPTFDSEFAPDEQLPKKFRIEIRPDKSGYVYLRWNGVKIGDPLTDSIKDSDGYRFHDVFHFAYATILHWSPVIRSLIKHKRKSDPLIDETQDGGRAKVVEEGLTAWIFSNAKSRNFFQGHEQLTFDMLKTTQEFTLGYEVEKCPLSLWERAILEGYRVFREVRKHNGGIVVGDRNARTIQYHPLG